MTDRKILKPAEGCLVHDPVSYEPLPEDGKSVEMDSYWYRRLAAGDVIEVQPASQAKQKGE